MPLGVGQGTAKAIVSSAHRNGRQFHHEPHHDQHGPAEPDHGDNRCQEYGEPRGRTARREVGAAQTHKNQDQGKNRDQYQRNEDKADQKHIAGIAPDMGIEAEPPPDGLRKFVKKHIAVPVDRDGSGNDNLGDIGEKSQAAETHLIGHPVGRHGCGGVGNADDRHQTDNDQYSDNRPWPEHRPGHTQVVSHRGQCVCEDGKT